jgi:hypothetical protein
MRGQTRRQGDRWDNAMTETRFGSSKVKQLHGMHFATGRQGKPFDSSPRSLIRIASLRSGDRSALVLQSPELARDAGISWPAGLRGTTASRSRKTHRIIARTRGTLTAGKVGQWRFQSLHPLSSQLVSCINTQFAVVRGIRLNPAGRHPGRAPRMQISASGRRKPTV